MRTEQLHYLITIARCGSMNKAAKELFITQPALSSAISALEKEIGVSLLKRQKQGISLTTAGEQIYQEALHILDNINNWTFLSEADEEISGSITISAFETVSYLILPDVISQLNSDYPKIDIYLEKFFTDRSLFYDDLFDIIITPSINEESFAENQRYHNEIIFHDYYVAFISKDNPLSQKPYVTMEELAQNKFAFTPESKFLQYMPEQLKQSQNFLYLCQKESIMATVAKNAAITIFPYIRQYHNFYVEKGKITAIPILDLHVSYDHLLIYPAEYRISPGQQVVLTYLKKAYSAFQARTFLQRKEFFANININITQ